MLAYILALAVGLGSLALYLGAFLTPELHRKNDFIWSGVGLFYALVLWVCAQRITGGVLLGQIAGVALLGWFAWQTVLLRRELLPAERQAAVLNLEALQQNLGQLSSGDISETVTGLFGTVAEQVQALLTTATAQKSQQPKPSKPKAAQPQPTPPQSSPARDEPDDQISEDGAIFAEAVEAAESTPSSVVADDLTHESTGETTEADDDVTPPTETELTAKTVTPPPEASPLSQATDLVGTVQKQAKEIWGMFFKPKKSRPMIELRRPAPVEAEPDGDGLAEADDVAESTPADVAAIAATDAIVAAGVADSPAADVDAIAPPVDPDAEDWFADAEPADDTAADETAAVETGEPATAESPVVEPTIESAEVAESVEEADEAEAGSAAIAAEFQPVTDPATDESVTAEVTPVESTEDATATTSDHPDSPEA